jgi:hypothetical protein
VDAGHLGRSRRTPAPSLLVAPERASAPSLLAIDLDAARAVLGRLSAGDIVDIYATTSSVGAPGTTRLVAADVYVVDAERIDIGGGRDRVELLLAVDDALAAELAAAKSGADLDVVRVGP